VHAYIHVIPTRASHLPPVTKEAETWSKRREVEGRLHVPLSAGQSPTKKDNRSACHAAGAAVRWA